MEVIWHEAIGQNITIWYDKLSHFLKEEKIVVRLKKNRLSVVTPVIDVI